MIHLRARVGEARLLIIFHGAQADRAEPPFRMPASASAGGCKNRYENRTISEEKLR
jgi:hypothetical protein